MKYVMLQIKQGDIIREFPFVFPEGLGHDIMAEFAIKACLKEFAPAGDAGRVEVTTVSAGFVSSTAFVGEDFHGSSKTLGIESRESDGAIAGMHDYHHGIV